MRRVFSVFLGIGLFCGSLVDVRGFAQEQAQVKAPLSLEDLKAHVDQLKISDLQQELRENRKLRREGQQLIRKQVMCLSFLSELQENIAVIKSDKVFVRFNKLRSDSDAVEKLRNEMKAAKTEEAVRSILANFLTSNDVTQEQLKRAMDLKKNLEENQAELEDCQRFLTKIGVDLETLPLAGDENRPAYAPNLMPTGGGVTAVERYKAFKNQWSPTPNATQPPPKEKSKSETQDIVKLFEAFISEK